MRWFHTAVAAIATLLVFHSSPAGVPVADAPSAAILPPVVAPIPSLAPVLGASGNLRALIGLPTSLEADTSLRPLLAGRAIDEPGVHGLGFATPDGESLVVVSMAAFADERASAAPGYRLGRWPVASRPRPGVDYTPPPGYVTVTPENRATFVSKRFQLGDFLTHDQQDVWPKALVLRSKLLDKLELIGDSLEHRGLPGRLHVMSGFRSPQYNALGVGEGKGGRARSSRHMYGDAADIFVDADGDGRMDDLDHDGRVDVRDARVLLAVAEGIEGTHPDLVGGLSAYPATSAHGPFVHVDTRGARARW